MKKFLSEFKEFIMRGNVLDMAVGVIVATAFGKITTSLVNDLFMPFISWLFGTRDMSALNLIVRPEIVENGAVVQEAITIGFGSFVAVVIDFLLMSLVVFIILKLFNKARAMTEKKGRGAGARGRACSHHRAAPRRDPRRTQKEFRGFLEAH